MRKSMGRPSQREEPLDHEGDPQFGVCDVLVVDREPVLRRVTAETLQEAGYRVIAARDGADALRVLEFASPWLVLLDVPLPVMGGAEFAQELRRREIQMRILVVGAGDVGRWADEINADGRLMKPFTPTQLLAEVNRLRP
jgi:two-component system, OmpR family, response regulator